MKKVLIVVSDYYEDVAAGLIKGATEYFDINKDKELFGREILIKYEIQKAPGAFEIPFFINKFKNLIRCFFGIRMYYKR